MESLSYTSEPGRAMFATECNICGYGILLDHPVEEVFDASDDLVGILCSVGCREQFIREKTNGL